MILHQPVVTAGQLAEALHALLHPCRHRLVEGVDALAGLEIGVGVLGGTAHHRMIGLRPRTVGAHPVVVDQRPNFIFVQRDYLVHLVGGAKAVEEVDERHPALQGDAVGDQGRVLRLLHRAGGEHGKTGAARRHHVLMVAKIDSPCAARIGPPWNTAEVNSPAILYMLGSISISPWLAVKVVASAPACRAPCTVPAAPFTLHLHDCGDVAPQVGLPSAAQASASSAMVELRVMG